MKRRPKDDVDEMIDHVNKELESEAAKWRDAENRAMKESDAEAKARSDRIRQRLKDFWWNK